MTKMNDDSQFTINNSYTYKILHIYIQPPSAWVYKTTFAPNQLGVMKVEDNFSAFSNCIWNLSDTKVYEGFTLMRPSIIYYQDISLSIELLNCNLPFLGKW